MSLRKKTIFVLSMALTFLILILAIISNYTIQRYGKEMEAHYVIDNVKQMSQAYDDILGNLNVTASDWSVWDETYDFVVKPNNEYITRHLTNPNFSNLNLSFMMIMNDNGDVVYGKGFDLAEQTEVPYPQNILEYLSAQSPLLQTGEENGVVGRSGLVILDNKPFMVASHPILTSEGSGPARGTLFVGRLLEGYNLFETFNFPKEESVSILKSEEKIYAYPENSQRILGYTVRDDIYGKPAIVLQTLLNRDQYQAGLITTRRFLVAVLLGGMIFTIFILLLMEKTVLARVAALSAGVRKIGESSETAQRLQVGEEQDELTQLSININKMLVQLEENHQNRTITDHVLDLVIRMDAQGILRYASPSHVAILGYNPEDILGKKVFHLVHPEDVPFVQSKFHEFLATQNPMRIEFRYQHADGHFVWIESVFSPLFDETGKLGSIIISSRDVSDRKEMEERLRFLSLYDTLTGLYNRTYFEQELLRMQNSRGGPVGIIICDVDGLKLHNDGMGHEAGDTLLEATAQVLKRCFREEDMVARIGGDEFAVLLPSATEEIIQSSTRRIRQITDEYNTAKPQLHLSISLGYAIRQKDQSMRDLFKEADNNMYREKLNRSQSARSVTAQILVKALAARDFITEGHPLRLQTLACGLAKAAGLPDYKITDIQMLARFHDIGKVGIPDRILFKEAPLNEDEREEMKRHCEIGYRIALSAPDLVPIADWILKHHEWWNGQGYPFGLKGTKIPIECRILAIANTYDAMVSNRPYRKAISHAEAMAEMTQCAGTQFDPSLIPLFIEVLEAYHDTTETEIA